MPTPLDTPSKGRVWWFRVLQAVVLAGAAYYLFRVAAPQWPAIRQRSLALRAGPLALSALLIVANLAWMIAIWRTSLRWCAERVHYWDVARVLGAVVVLLLPRLTRRLPSLARLWSQLKPWQLLVFALLLTLQWLAYGAAFRFLAIGLLGSQGAAGQASWGFYITAFTESYLAGVIAVFAPPSASHRVGCRIALHRDPRAADVLGAVARFSQRRPVLQRLRREGLGQEYVPTD